MGDRVCVTLTVLTVHAEAAKQIIEPYCGTPDEVLSYKDFTDLTYEDINYANLQCERDLTEAGIAYDKTWEAGAEFDCGVEYVRFTETGEHSLIELSDGEGNPDIDQLWGRLNNYTDLVDYIKTHRNNTTALPWDNQVEYGKRYLARKLITPE